ncbi:MAG: hypothetical protein AAGF98_02300 [Cyanobacteria bacterium P01_H01_bin.153]
MTDFVFQPKPEGDHYIQIHYSHKLITDGKATTAALLSVLEYLAKASLEHSDGWQVGDTIPDEIPIQGDCNYPRLNKLLDGLLKPTAVRDKLNLLHERGLIRLDTDSDPRRRLVTYCHRAITEALSQIEIDDPPKSEPSEKWSPTLQKVEPPKNGGWDDPPKSEPSEKWNPTLQKVEPYPPKNGGITPQKMGPSIPLSNPKVDLKVDPAVPAGKNLLPEKFLNTETSDVEGSVSPIADPIDSAVEPEGSGGDKDSGARSQIRKYGSKAGRAERIYRQLEGDSRYEANKFYQWFEWYKRRLCEPYGKAHGDKAGAAESWMNLVESGVNLQQVSAGSTQYLSWVRANPDRRACEIPHAHNFLEGKVNHPTPYWQLALEDATAAPVNGPEFVAEPAPTMTRQDWSKRLGELLRETGYLLPDASGDCPGTRYVTSASALSADELPALVMWLETPPSERRSA